MPVPPLPTLRIAPPGSPPPPRTLPEPPPPPHRPSLYTPSNDWWLRRVRRMAFCGSASHFVRQLRYTVSPSRSGKRRRWGELNCLWGSVSRTAHHTPCRSIPRWFLCLAIGLCYYCVPKPFPAPTPLPTWACRLSRPPRVAKAPPRMGHRPPGYLRYHMMHTVSQLILVWTIKSVATSHYVTWFPTQLIPIVCNIRRRSDLWGHCSSLDNSEP